MSYARNNLIPGENIIYETRLHWVVLVWHTLLAILFLFGPGVALIYYYHSGDDSRPYEYLGAGLIAAAVIVIVIGMIRRNATEMAVTNKRVLIKVGIMKRRTLEILLQKVESLEVEENFMGRILSFGTVVVRGTGGTPEPFTKIAHPLEFRRQVEQQINLLSHS
jgi:uncharacterized membrane protein YdbT with pleckstrin-like domain